MGRVACAVSQSRSRDTSSDNEQAARHSHNSGDHRRSRDVENVKTVNDSKSSPTLRGTEGSNPSSSAAESVSPHRPVRARRSHGCGSFSLSLARQPVQKRALLTSPSSRDQSVYLSPSLGSTARSQSNEDISEHENSFDNLLYRSAR